ncbi:uncharacterized protein LOC101861567 [Aplysia californica]|uniref:Uncharacterized protein LOC101861567 n=1 Tax=Aplysia californica TaxID=6500 RepID=A0ABM0ZW85_APLCA|nr:uncharacterized protein LOC101861567 [Aplysia californica]
MLTSTPLSVLSFIMETVHQLDPALLAFWEGFPCPPPWKEDLLFRLNWTGCVGTEVGERVKLYMADKCKIRHDGVKVLPGPGDGAAGGGGDGVLVDDTCALTCQIIIGVVSVLFIVLLTLVVVVCVRRHRAKPASPSHQSSLTAHPDNAKYYTSCHYACAPVVARQLQTTLQGDRTETRVVPASASGATSSTTSATVNGGHYYPGSYPQHDCQQVNYHHHHHHPSHISNALLHQQQQQQQQQQQPPRLINTPYGQVPAHTSSLVVPQHSRYAPSHYKKLDGGVYNSSSSCTSDRSPVYESIGDNDSIRERCRGARDTSVSECEFCECCEHGSEQGGGGSAGYAGYQDPVFFKGDPPTSSSGGEYSADKIRHRPYHDPATICPHRPTEDPPGPCPPMFSDGFYGDKGSPQTLPLRPLRGGGRGGKASSINELPDGDEPGGVADERIPLKSGSVLLPEGGEEGSMRRRPSSGSSYSNSSSHYREGNYNGQRRPIPALHPHYFVASPDDTIS